MKAFFKSESIGGRAALIAMSAAALTLAMAPCRQFYLGWIGLAPWLLVVAQAKSARAAFGWGMLGGAIFFAANLWPIALLTFSGALLLTLALAMTWGLAAAVARRCRLLDVLEAEQRHRRLDARKLFLRIAAMGCVFVTAEFLRSRIILEFPLLQLAHTQTPFLHICQIADLGGTAAVTFLIVVINMCIAMFFVRPRRRRAKILAAAAWLGVIIIALLYGDSRMDIDRAPGPRVMVVQSNVKFGRGGAVSVNQQAQFRSIYATTVAALEAGRISGEPNVDLVVWPESITPPINDEAQTELRTFESGPWLMYVDQTLSKLAARYETAIVVGGFYVGDWKPIAGKRTGTDIRNAAYLYDKQGQRIARYDKIHLVPFGEYIPLGERFPKLARLWQFLSPTPMNYIIRPGPKQRALPLRTDAGPLGFAPVICFEDGMPERISAMAVPQRHAAKDADFIASLSNDGWFNRQFMAQRFDAAIFCCIENRIPMARSENGGISGFVDSLGHRAATLSPWSEGALAAQLQLDTRQPLYQLTGDWFAGTCSVVTGLLLINALWRRRRRVRRGDAKASATST